MKQAEIIERGFTIDRSNRVLDNSGNEYRNEDGNLEFAEFANDAEEAAFKQTYCEIPAHVSEGDEIEFDGDFATVIDIDRTSDKENPMIQPEFADGGTLWVKEDNLQF